jgi:hypothetical protein
MKQLLITFFAIILCYSLFFDRESDAVPVDEMNCIYEGAAPDLYFSLDTLNFHTYNEMWNPYFSDERVPVSFGN